MKKILTILLFAISFAASGQSKKSDIKQWGTAEYFCAGLTNAGRVYGPYWDGSKITFGDFGINANFIEGAQYVSVVTLKSGRVAIVTKAGTGGIGSGGGAYVDSTSYLLDTLGNSFTCTHAWGWFQTIVALKNDSLWYIGKNSLSYGSLNLGSGQDITKWTKLNQPPGRIIDDVVMGDLDEVSFIVHCTDSTVWKYYRANGATPVQVGTIKVGKIGTASRYAFIGSNATKIYAWGQRTSIFGLADNTTTPTDVTSVFTAAGLVMPLKKIGSGSNVIHVIDANDNLFGAGDNVMGEVGNGLGYNPWRTYKNGTSSQPFAWDQGVKAMMQPVVQIRGKWKDVSSGTQISYYKYAQDLYNNWYSWGRGKSNVLNNGYQINNEGAYPNFRSVYGPRRLDTTLVNYPAEYTFVATDSLKPVAVASAWQGVTTDTAWVYSDYSNNQGNPSLTTTWTQVSGPNSATIVSSTSANTKLTGLINGTYKFRVLKTNISSLTDADTTTVIVNLASNTNPVCDSITVKYCRQPIYADVTFSATDADGFISSATVTKISGAGTPVITALTNTSSVFPYRITAVTPGIYVFRFTATDNNGGSCTKDVTVEVKGAVIQRARMIISKNY